MARLTDARHARQSPVLAAVAIGSNLGDRRAHLTWAVDQLGALLDGLRASDIIETEPVDVPDPQPPYLNMVVTGMAALPAGELMEALLDLERRQGRSRPALRAPRTLDLDLVLYGQSVIDLPSLTVPHPRFRTRQFVLAPLAALVPDWVDPVTGRTVQELLDALPETKRGA